MAQERGGLKLSLFYFGDDWFRLVLQPYKDALRRGFDSLHLHHFGLSVLRLEESELYRAFVALRGNHV